MMRQVLTQKNNDKAVRVGVWKCFVMSVLLTGSETWCPTATEIEALERSAHRHLRSTLGLRTHKVEGEWDTASRERIRGLAAIQKFSQILRERRLHVRRTIMCFPSTSIVRALLEEEDWEVRTIHHSMDWGKRTAQDMRDCGLTVEMAELPSEWNKRSAAEKTKKDIPYTDAEEETTQAWNGRKTFWTDGSSCDKRKRAGFGILEGTWSHGEDIRGTYFRTPGKQTVNRAEIAAILWALREGTGCPIIIVSDSENAIRACAGYTIKGSEDLCSEIHMELAGRAHSATFLKVVSHPLKKKKRPNWAHWGNDVVDNLAAMGRDLPAEETWEPKRPLDREPKPVARSNLGKTYFHRADNVCQPCDDFSPIAPSDVEEKYGERLNVGPKNTLARFLAGFERQMSAQQGAADGS